MSTINITKENALKAYNAGCSDVKAVLENLLGKKSFLPENIMDRIETFADVCELNETTKGDFLEACEDAGLEPDEIAYRQMKLICKAYNQGWVPDFNNSEAKWYVWFYLNEPGFRLYDAYYDYSASAVGARLVFKSKEHALDAANKFKSIYEAYFTLNTAVETTGETSANVENDPFTRDCKILGYDPLTIIPDLSRMPSDLQKPVRSFIRLLVGTAAKRGNHKFDYQNRDEEKWYPWWDMEKDENNPSGFRLDDALCDDTDSLVGARLSLRDEKEVREVAEEYIDDYRNVMKQ